MQKAAITCIASGRLLAELNRNWKFFMKVSTICLFIILSLGHLLVAATGYGQNSEERVISLEFKNAPLWEVFKSIESQANVTITYEATEINRKGNVSIAGKDITVGKALDQILEKLKLQWSVTDDVIRISKAIPTLKESNRIDLSLNQTLPITIRGRIINEANEPMLASISIKGSTRGTTSDNYGNFELIGVENDAVLIISATNIETEEINLLNRGVKALSKNIYTLNIVVKTVASSLNEVVVNKGYYSSSRKLNTGSISKVSGDVISKQPISNPVQALQGRVPGVVIDQYSGIQGSSMQIIIRGKNSIQNGTDPLYVIDGVPILSKSLSNLQTSGSFYGGLGISPLYNIDPNNIESIEILKDADATAIYGSRGANGVVLISTKKGKRGKSKIDFNISSGASKVPHFIDLLNTEEYLKVRRQAFQNDNRSIGPNHYDINGVWDSTRYTNWQKELIGGTAKLTTVSATLSGGQGNTQYSLGGSYQKQGTVYPGSSITDKNAINFSLVNESPDEKFKIRFSTNVVHTKNNMLGMDLTSTAMNLVPDAPKLFNEDGNINYENSTWDNPIAYINQPFKQTTNSLISNTVIGYEIRKGLIIKSSFGLNYLSSFEQLSTPSNFYDPAFGVTPEYAMNLISEATNQSWIAEPQITYDLPNLSFGKLSMLIGASFQDQRGRQILTNYTGFPSDDLITDPYSAQTQNTESSSATIYKYSALFGRVNYNLLDKYIINVTGRRDGSSRFGPGKQFANLGAIAGAWIFSNERFTKEFSWLSFGKIRASYGLTGNDQIGDYSYFDNYISNSDYQGVTGLSPIRLFNDQYAWETTNKFEVAVEIGLLKDRITLNTAYYKNRSSNQLVNYQVSAVTGFNSFIQNLSAKIENSGFEIEINTINLNGALRWTSAFNLSLGKTKLLEFPNLASSSYAKQYVIGKSLILSRLYEYEGVDPATGIYQFKDQNGDGTITDADRTVFVDRTQKYYGGINNSVSFKRFSLDIFLQFVKKNASNPLRDLFDPGGRVNFPTDILHGAWTSVESKNAVYSRYTTNNGTVISGNDKFRNSDAIITNGSFVRLKNVSITYSVPRTFIKVVSANIFLQGQNLLTWTNYKGLDPEQGSLTRLPTLRTIVGGLQIAF